MKMVFNHKQIEKIDMGKGVIRQDFAEGKNMNVLHWNMSDGSEVGMHTHPQEQFGYVIKGGFHLTIGDQVYEPSNPQLSSSASFLRLNVLSSLN